MKRGIKLKDDVNEKKGTTGNGTPNVIFLTNEDCCNKLF